MNNRLKPNKIRVIICTNCYNSICECFAYMLLHDILEMRGSCKMCILISNRIYKTQCVDFDLKILFCVSLFYNFANRNWYS